MVLVSTAYIGAADKPLTYSADINGASFNMDSLTATDFYDGICAYGHAEIGFVNANTGDILTLTPDRSTGTNRGYYIYQQQ